MLFKHISSAVQEFKEELIGRKEGTIKSLRVGSKKLNKVLFNGFEWYRIVTLAGMSGSGKSMILKQWEREFFFYNKEQDFEVLAFEFEMLPIDQIARNVSGKTGKSIRELYSVDETLKDEDLDSAFSEADKMSLLPIFYVSKFLTVEKIKKEIIDFVKVRKLKENKKGIIITVDHVLLTLGKDTERESTIIKELYLMAVELKQEFKASNIPVLFIFLSQMNREVLNKEERITNVNLHFPKQSDLFGSSHIFFASDIVIVSHRPALIQGLTHYGPPIGKYKDGLPLRNEQTGRDLIYWHILKFRQGKTPILMMEEHFDKSKILDYNG